jgi:hypothetical protein
LGGLQVFVALQQKGIADRQAVAWIVYVLTG